MTDNERLDKLKEYMEYFVDNTMKTPYSALELYKLNGLIIIRDDWRMSFDRWILSEYPVTEEEAFRDIK